MTPAAEHADEARRITEAILVIDDDEVLVTDALACEGGDQFGSNGAHAVEVSRAQVSRAHVSRTELPHVEPQRPGEVLSGQGRRAFLPWEAHVQHPQQGFPEEGLDELPIDPLHLRGVTALGPWELSGGAATGPRRREGLCGAARTEGIRRGRTV